VEAVVNSVVHHIHLEENQEDRNHQEKQEDREEERVPEDKRMNVDFE
jgi:hypothetical protein